jgi:hypothetical protein
MVVSASAIVVRSVTRLPTIVLIKHVCCSLPNYIKDSYDWYRLVLMQVFIVLETEVMEVSRQLHLYSTTDLQKIFFVIIKTR